MEKSKLGSLPEVMGFGTLHLLAQALARDCKWLGDSLVAERLEIVIDHKRFQLSRSFYDKAWAGLLRRLVFSWGVPQRRIKTSFWHIFSGIDCLACARYLTPSPRALTLSFEICPNFSIFSNQGQAGGSSSSSKASYPLSAFNFSRRKGPSSLQHIPPPRPSVQPCLKICNWMLGPLDDMT
ncbi:hypothetical protein AMTR_s00047p00057940 [Amborella trichopoda]|uniref:Uncharacterized protein n=1 Tax=Amborella trichopoda TaxID=13333 RepID=U5D5L0_AMBTC|nr:hypothetical protein AMTR_s00047p00057940 [Amborella trichopoda]